MQRIVPKIKDFGWPWLLILIAATALNQYKFEVAGASVKIEHLAELVLLLVIGYGLKQGNVILRLERSDFFLGLFMVIISLATLLNAADRTEGIKFIGLMGLAILNYFLVRLLVKSEETFRLMALAVLVAGMAVALWGIIAWVLYPFKLDLGVTLYRIISAPAEQVVPCTFSPYASQVEPNIFASYVLGAGLLGIGWQGLGGKRLPMWLYYAALVLTPVALALSLTRSAWAGFVVGLLTLLFLAQNKKAILKKGVIFIAITLPLVYLVANYQLACTLILPQSPDAPVQTVRVDQSQPNGPKTNNNTGQPQTELIPSGQAGSRLLAGDSISWRLGVVSRALEDWWQNPLIGNGANTFAQKYITSSNTPDWIGNMLLMSLHDSGLIGFGLFMGWFGWLFLVAFRSVTKAENRETAIIVMALCVSFAGLLVVFQFSSALWLGFSWLQLGLIRAGTLLIKAKSAAPDRIAASIGG